LGHVPLLLLLGEDLYVDSFDSWISLSTFSVQVMKSSSLSRGRAMISAS
jgi:hypothetical protein